MSDDKWRAERRAAAQRWRAERRKASGREPYSAEAVALRARLEAIELDGATDPLVRRIARDQRMRLYRNVTPEKLDDVRAACAWFLEGCVVSAETRGLAGPWLYDYRTGEPIRPATTEEQARSQAAAADDGGAGVIEVDGRDCYVVD